MPILAMTTSKPLFKRLDEYLWILHNSEAKFVENLMHLWGPAEFFCIMYQ